MTFPPKQGDMAPGLVIELGVEVDEPEPDPLAWMLDREPTLANMTTEPPWGVYWALRHAAERLGHGGSIRSMAKVWEKGTGRLLVNTPLLEQVWREALRDLTAKAMCEAIEVECEQQ